ncbi:MAG: MarR family transcriptional regulator [Blastochloris sp.]|nr:MarR family transcriptional regulator [Blastochloris sp.]
MESTKKDWVASDELVELADLTMYLQRFFLVSLSEHVQKRKISISQYTLLGFLSVQDSLNMTTLASLMGHSTPATTGLINRLVEAQLVQRSTSKEDGRVTLVQITRRGRAVMEEMKLELMQNLDAIRQQLNPEDQQSWPRIYKVMKESCAQRLRSTGHPVD